MGDTVGETAGDNTGENIGGGVGGVGGVKGERGSVERVVVEGEVVAVVPSSSSRCMISSGAA